MAKCMKCGKNTLLRGHVALKDGAICTPCYKALGYKLSDVYLMKFNTYDEIKDGEAARIANSIKERIKEDVISSISVTSNIGERELVCTEEERQMFNLISNHFPTEELRLVRVSDNYVTIKRREWDIARIKYTNKAKWIIFPCLEVGSVRHEIGSVDDCAAYFDQIRESIDFAKKSEV